MEHDPITDDSITVEMHDKANYGFDNSYALIHATSGLLMCFSVPAKCDDDTREALIDGAKAWMLLWLENVPHLGFVPMFGTPEPWPKRP